MFAFFPSPAPARATVASENGGALLPPQPVETFDPLGPGAPKRVVADAEAQRPATEELSLEEADIDSDRRADQPLATTAGPPDGCLANMQQQQPLPITAKRSPTKVHRSINNE